MENQQLTLDNLVTVEAVHTHGTFDLINGDCYEKLKEIPDGSVDLVIIDPPYEFDMGGGGGSFGTKKRNYHEKYLALYKETGTTKKRKH